MPSTDRLKSIQKYLSRNPPLFDVPKRPLINIPHIIIVIPCFNEPDLTGTLSSLLACELPDSPVEVIVVVNQAENADQEITTRNQHTIEEFNEWQTNYEKPGISFYLIEALEQPKKHAGVGLARKLGMDEALRRFAAIQTDGVIACLDADCRVSPNYLTVLTSDFERGGASLGTVYFEHRFEQEKDESLKTGIVFYELFLRYHVEGLRQAGFPQAIHTVGSCMLVRASAYARHGGMNKRKAGEDFYFLHKIAPHEGHTDVTGTTVFPSCRTSDRVPFGTGRAQQNWLQGKREDYLTYDPLVYSELEKLLATVPAFYRNEAKSYLESLTTPSRQFLEAHDYPDKIERIKKNCSSHAQFQKQFFIWFDGFLCMKFVHFLRDHFYPNISISKAASTLINHGSSDPEGLLKAYRAIDRKQRS